LPDKIEAQVREMQKRKLRPDRAVISLDGRPETYARIRGVKDGFGNNWYIATHTGR